MESLAYDMTVPEWQKSVELIHASNVSSVVGKSCGKDGKRRSSDQQVIKLHEGALPSVISQDTDTFCEVADHGQVAAPSPLLATSCAPQCALAARLAVVPAAQETVTPAEHEGAAIHAPSTARSHVH